MLMKLLTIFSVLVFFHTTVEGRYRIAMLTDIEYKSATNHWVGIRAHGSEGSTSWMWPKFQTRTGKYDYIDINDKSVGDMTKVDFKLEKSGIRFYSDQWKGAKVVITDFVTGKVFEASPGWIEHGKVKTVLVKLISNECKDKNPVACDCIRDGSRETQFKLATHYFENCLKTCHICYSPKASDEEASGDVKAAKVYDGEDEGDREGEPEDEDDENKHEQEHEDEKEKRQ